MHGTMMEFRANGGMAAGYLSLPPSGHGPGLLVLQEWWRWWLKFWDRRRYYS